MTKRVALLNVDLQIDFFVGGPLGVTGSNEIIKPVNKINEYAIAQGYIRLASRCWHKPTSKHFEKWPAHGIENTPGAQFHPDIKMDGVKVFDKGTDPEDDGYDPYPVISKYLDQNGIVYLLICGLATDYCVKAGAISAAKARYKVIVMEDACRAVKPEDGVIAINEMKKAGVIISTTDEVIRLGPEAVWSIAHSR